MFTLLGLNLSFKNGVGRAVKVDLKSKTQLDVVFIYFKYKDRQIKAYIYVSLSLY